MPSVARQAMPASPRGGRHVLAGQAIFADDTPVAMLAPGTGKTQTARLWAYGRDERPWGSAIPPASWYRFSSDRKGEHPKDHLAKYSGWMHAPSHGLQANHCRATDGYAGFEDLYRNGAIREVACMAHVRRKFVPSRACKHALPGNGCAQGPRLRHRRRGHQADC